MFAQHIEIHLLDAQFEESAPIFNMLERASFMDQPIMKAAEVVSGAGPRIILRSINDSRPHWVELNIPDSYEKMAFVERVGFETTLPEVPAPFFTKVYPSGINPMGFAEGFGQGAFGPGNGNKMHMIRHQAVRPEIYLEFFEMVFEEPEVEDPVMVIEKSRLAAVSLLDNMVGDADHFKARTSRHGRGKAPVTRT